VNLLHISRYCLMNKERKMSMTLGTIIEMNGIALPELNGNS
jgi:hypothetical protein